MTTLYYAASSLDGYIADDAHALGWLLQFGEPAENYFAEFLAGVGALAMGATTYEWLLDHLAGTRPPQPWPYPQPTWVFTRRSLRAADGADIRFASGDVGAAHRDMLAAAGGKAVWIVGGGELAGQFHDRGLLDEIVVSITPVTLGSGTPLLPRRIADPPLRLLSAKRCGDAFVDLRYAVPRAGTDAGAG